MKRGITISTLGITVVIMLIVISVTAIAGSSTINNARDEENISKIRRVQDAVLAYKSEHKELPTTGDMVAFSGLKTDIKSKITALKDNENKLFLVDMSKLGIDSSIGNGEHALDDVFIVAEGSNNVYYVSGVLYKSNTIYSCVQ